MKYIKLKTLITDFYEILDITKERISDLEDTVGITQNASQSYKWLIWKDGTERRLIEEEYPIWEWEFHPMGIPER